MRKSAAVLALLLTLFVLPSTVAGGDDCWPEDPTLACDARCGTTTGICYGGWSGYYCYTVGTWEGCIGGENHRCCSSGGGL